MAGAQQQINLTAGPTTATYARRINVPMWGYSCGATRDWPSQCGSLRRAEPSTRRRRGWSPVMITVPTGATGGLTINLTNNLSSKGQVPTSIMIVGQVGGGLGTHPTTTPSPTHADPGDNVARGGHSKSADAYVHASAARAARTVVRHGSGCGKDNRGGRLTGHYSSRARICLNPARTPPSRYPWGLYGILVVTAAPTASATARYETAPGSAYPPA